MITKKCKYGGLNVAFISDVHTGHPKVCAEHITGNLYKAFPDNAETAALDIIFIAGDFFDRNLYLSHEGIGAIQLFIQHLIRLCEIHDIILRVLEGTPSHDWKQGCIFPQIRDLMGASINLRWVENLSIEYIEELDINVLYVPDEWEHDPDETWRQVQGLLHDHGLDKVQFSIMHGMFEFQIPAHVKITHHRSDRYLGITEHYISIGHHHTQRQFSRILVQGSFDRLCHGEEGPKGHYRVKINADGNGNDSIRFVENEGAMKFITVDCLDLTLSDTIDKLKDVVSPLPAGSHVRVIARAGSEVASAKRELEQMWETIRWTINREAVEAMVGEEKLKLAVKHQAADINKDSVVRLLEPRLANLDASKREKLVTLLTGVL